MASFGWHTTSGNVVIGDALAIRHHQAAIDARLLDARAAFDAERYDDAYALAFAVLARAPGHAEANYVAGVCAKRLRGAQQALPYLQKAARNHTTDKDRCYALAVTLSELNEPARALPWIEFAIAADASDARLRFRYALILAALGHSEQARAALEKSVRLDGNQSISLSALGNTLRNDGELVHAVDCYVRAARIDAFEETLYGNAAVSFQELGDFDAALELSRTALAIEPFNRLYLSNYLLALNYLPGLTPAELDLEHARFGLFVKHSGPAATAPIVRAGEKLRVGLVSPDFRQHPVARFVEPLLKNAAQQQLHIVCYFDSGVDDNITQELRALAADWRVIFALSDDDVAARIEADELDVLLDLAGHTSANRLSLYTRRLAAVQGAWLGYPGAAGVEALEFRLTDRACEPGRAERSGVLCMDGPFLCFGKPSVEPAVRTMHAGATRFICLNNVAKMSPPVLRAWAEILRRLPDATLVLKSRLFVEEAAHRLLRDRLRLAGIDTARVEMHAPMEEFAEHLSFYDRADVALDTFPYNGTTTSCEALWMGVPLVTVRGQAHAGCVSAGILSSMGLADELVAEHVSDYVEKAVLLATDHTLREQLHRRIATEIPRAALTDGRNYVQRFAAALRTRMSKVASQVHRPDVVIIHATNLQLAGWLCTEVAAACLSPCKRLGGVDEVDAFLAETVARDAIVRRQDRLAITVATQWDDRMLTWLEHGVVRAIHIESNPEVALLRHLRERTPPVPGPGQGGGPEHRGSPELQTRAGTWPVAAEVMLEAGRVVADERARWRGAQNVRHVEEVRLRNEPAAQVRAAMRWLGWDYSGLAEVMTSLPNAPASVEQMLSTSDRAAIANAARRGVAQSAPLLVHTQAADSLPVQLCDGAWIQVPPDVRVLTTFALLERGDWFEAELAFMRDFLRPGMRVLDVGANHGVYALSAAMAVARRGRVWAVEPGPAAATRLLRASLVPGGASVEVMNYALGAHDADGRLATDANSEMRAIGATGDVVDIRALDACAAEAGIDRVDFMKLDVEGGELDVLTGASRWLQINSPVIQLEVRAGKEVELVAANWLQEQGFRLYQLVPGLGVLKPLPEILDAYTLNLYALRDETAVALSKRGLLLANDDLTEHQAVDTDQGVESATDWRTWLARQQYGAMLLPQWLQRLRSVGNSSRTLLAAIGLYAYAHTTGTQPLRAWRALQRAERLLEEGMEDAPGTLALRQLSLVTVQLELGERAKAVRVLGELMAQLPNLPHPSVEPFLVPCSHYAALPPHDGSGWLQALVRATWQRNAVFSSWHAQADSLHNVNAFVQLGIADAWMERVGVLLRALSSENSQQFDPRHWPPDDLRAFNTLPHWPSWLNSRLPLP